jgi:hypothetical protein
MPRLPQAGAIFRARGPFKSAAAAFLAMSPNIADCSATSASVPWNSSSSSGVSGSVSLE